MNKGSRRARRMDRHHKAAKQPALNLVSLMDIFTILVFFLLVNSSNSPQLPNKKDLVLPDSIAKKAPQETLVIAITKTDVLLQGQKIGEIAALGNNEEPLLMPLKKELDFLAQEFSQEQIENGGRVTVMGDENTPYELVSKILYTCRQANFTQIAFAATQVAAHSE